MRTLKTLLCLILLASVAYKANAYYQYRKAQDAKPPSPRTVTARGGELRLTLSGSGVLQPQETKIVAVREVQSTIVQIVEDGSMVKAGQVVCQLDTTALLKDLHDRQEAYDTAKATLASTEADVMLNLNDAATKAKKAGQDQHLLLATNSATTQEDRAAVDYNQSDFKMAQGQKDRKETLAHDQLIPEHDVAIADLNVQGKKLNVVTAQKQLEVQESTEKIGVSQGEMLIEDAKFGEEAAKNKQRQQVANVQYNALQARRALELTQFQIQCCTIKAPSAGLAVVQRQYDESVGGARPLRAGDQVFRSRALMELVDTARMQVQADVGEIDIGHVRAGQAARVFPRAAPEVALRARVKSVAEVAQAPSVSRHSNRLPGKKVFRVVLTVLDSRPKLLRPGMSADFEVIEEAIAQGVRVPIQSVFPVQVFGRSGVPAFRSRKSTSGSPLARAEHLNARTPEPPSSGLVYVRKEGRFWPRTVQLGKRNDTDILVTKGLKAGDVLSERLPPASLIGPAVQRERPPRASGLLSLLPWGLGR